MRIRSLMTVAELKDIVKDKYFICVSIDIQLHDQKLEDAK
jgi:hypothetical protein